MYSYLYKYMYIYFVMLVDYIQIPIQNQHTLKNFGCTWMCDVSVIQISGSYQGLITPIKL